MSELTFNTFNPQINSVYEIGDGVIGEMAQAFEHELSDQPNTDNLGELIGKIGPAKTLQDNIPQVQAVLGTNADALDIAIDWVERSGLMLPANRSYADSELAMPATIDTAVITGGVRNWMMRRAERFGAIKNVTIGQVLLVAGNREMKPAEGPDVAEGMTEANYLESVIKPMLEGMGTTALVNLVRVDSSVGDEVMNAAAQEATGANQLVVSNAAAWVQNAGQFRRAMQNRIFGYDSAGNQLYVVSDTIPVAHHGEPPATHQNPLTALGQIARNAQELTRHQ
jgi:hypothetical protein